MRFSLTAALAVASVSAIAQTSGVYQPAGGPAVAWKVSDSHTLIWDNQPYLPVGVRVNGTTDDISAAKAAGFQDLIVDVSPNGAGWKEAMGLLESSGMRYILSVDSLIPSAKGFAVEPEAYRVDGITADRHVDLPLPGATSALAVLVSQRDSSIETSKRVPVVDGKFSFDVKSQSDLEQVLLIYPEQSDASHPDYWDGFDAQRDILLTSLQQNKPGKGLRGILNPLGRMFNSSLGTGLFVPESAFFRLEFASYLESKYRNVETTLRAWGIGTNDIVTFEGVSRLVPLWSGQRGVGELWDPATDNLYSCDQKHTQIWTDIRTVISLAAAKRFERLVPSLQSVADVPVIQEWTGWSAPFEAGKPELTGIGFTISGKTVQDVIDSASRPTSSLLRWKDSGWLVCTQVNIDKDSESSASLSSVLDNLESMGSRGLFFPFGSPSKVTISASEASRRSGDTGLTQLPPSPMYFPENAFNPAVPKRLAGGRWWLPSPEDGNRIDYGAGFYGYQYTDGTSFCTMIWELNGPQRVRLRLRNPKLAAIGPVNGVDRKAKLAKNGIELDMDENPVLVTTTGDFPVPEAAFLETSYKYEQLIGYGNRFHRDITEDAFFFKDAVTGYDNDPSGSFLKLRKRFWLLNKKLGAFQWIEAETTRTTNFSQIVPASGCSDGSILLLNTPVTTDPAGFYARYDVSIRSPDEQEVWIAGRIPKEAEKYISIEVSGQKLHITEGPVSSYSSGFGWYKLGTTRLAGQRAQLSLDVNSSEGAYLAIDAVLLYPGHFKPDGITMPDAITFVPLGAAKKKGRS